jgi:hypothetical protein
LCLALALATPGAVSAQSVTLIHLAPGTATVEEGQLTGVQVRVENVENLYAFDIRLKFDPAAVEVVDSDSEFEGLQVRLGDLLKPDFVVHNLADNAEGTVRLALTQLNPSEGVTGSGVLFAVTFRGKRAGASSPLSFTYQQLVSRTGDVILASVEEGQIRVLEAQQTPSTPTTAPTSPPLTAAPTQPPVATIPTAASSAALLPSATAVPPTAVAPTSLSAAAVATSMPPATLVQVAQATTPISPPPAVRVSSALPPWLIVYAVLFALGLAVAILGPRVRRRKQP